MLKIRGYTHRLRANFHFKFHYFNELSISSGDTIARRLSLVAGGELWDPALESCQKDVLDPKMEHTYSFSSRTGFSYF